MKRRHHHSSRKEGKEDRKTKLKFFFCCAWMDSKHPCEDRAECLLRNVWRGMQSLSPNNVEMYCWPRYGYGNMCCTKAYIRLLLSRKARNCFNVYLRLACLIALFSKYIGYYGPFLARDIGENTKEDQSHLRLG